MSKIKVVINGILGKMGQEVLNAVCSEPNLVPSGGSDYTASQNELALPNNSGQIPVSSSLESLSCFENSDVVVDFTNASGALSAIKMCCSSGKSIVVGSTGMTEKDIDEVKNLAHTSKSGIFIAPNFAIGMAVMMHLTKVASRFFKYADLTETHHEAKIDSPSGTAIAIAQAAASGKSDSFDSNIPEKQTIVGTRGGIHQGINIHSARMPGRVAHHEIVFGELGQTLSIRHDSINRQSFMPGVVMAINHVNKNPGLTIGLENILGL